MSKMKNKKDLYKPLVSRMVSHLLDNDYAGCESVINDSLRSQLQPGEIYSHILSGAMMQIGKLWHSGKISIAHEHLATQMTASIVDMVADKFPKLSSNGKIAIIATTSGETHWMGAKVFSKLLELEGWEVHYLGYDTPQTDLASYADSQLADIVVISIVRDSYILGTIEAIDKIQELDPAPVILVGGPATEDHSEVLKKSNVLLAPDFISGMDMVKDAFGLSADFSSLEEVLVGIGTNIQNTRKSRSMSQMELAEIAGVDRAYISLVENGKQNITMSALHKFSEALGVSLISLMPSLSSIE